MKDLEKCIVEFADRNGVDVLGFAPRERFEGVDPQHNPFSIFPDGKTVIMLGKRITRGTLRGIEEGSNFGDYTMWGRNWLEDTFITVNCYDLTRIIENAGYEAVPIFPNPVEAGPMGVSVREGKPAPNVHPDFEYAAVAAGVAEIAFSGILLGPEFGSRQRFHMIITDAELEPTPLLKQSICDLCGKCAAACPLGAISVDETEKREICGKSMTVAKINDKLCKKCQNGAQKNRFIGQARPDRIAAACNRACLIHLEENGLINNLFENKFRKSPVWALDADGEYMEMKS